MRVCRTKPAGALVRVVILQRTLDSNKYIHSTPHTLHAHRLRSLVQIPGGFRRDRRVASRRVSSPSCAGSTMLCTTHYYNLQRRRRRLCRFAAGCMAKISRVCATKRPSVPMASNKRPGMANFLEQILHAASVVRGRVRVVCNPPTSLALCGRAHMCV